MKNVYGYVRVSSKSQNYEGQVENIKLFCKMREFNLVKIFGDRQSGKNMDRVEFQKMMETLVDFRNPQQIETIIITKLDRVGRNVSDLIGFIKTLEMNKIDLATTLESFDTTTPQGRLFFYIMSALAEYERELIRERTEAGFSKYLKSGGKMGPERKIVDIEEVKRLLEIGVPKAAIAKKMKISIPTLYDRLEEEYHKNVKKSIEEK